MEDENFTFLNQILIDTNIIWEIKRQDDLFGEKVGVLIVTGHDLPSPDEIAAKCVSPEAREEIIKKVHATKLLVKN